VHNKAKKFTQNMKKNTPINFVANKHFPKSIERIIIKNGDKKFGLPNVDTQRPPKGFNTFGHISSIPKYCKIP
jgi:hypothetical protein